MNRQYKRLMKKQEEQKKNAPRPVVKPPGAPTKKQRTKPRAFVREVGEELRKVAWPTRPEVVAYSVVVLVSVIIIGAMIYVMDSVFTKAVSALFGVHL
ncbi:MAG: preprotein translocase subunit SecE [Actinomycetota bacterium]|nr:preprotein translocase subunit SecE [Actinomycetota bacterium]